MRTFKEFMGTGAVAGLTGEPPVHLKKKRKKDLEVLTRFVKKRDESNDYWSKAKK